MLSQEIDNEADLTSRVDRLRQAAGRRDVDAVVAWLLEVLPGCMARVPARKRCKVALGVIDRDARDGIHL